MTQEEEQRAQLRRGAEDLRLLTSVGIAGPILGTMIDMTREVLNLPRMDDELRRWVTGPIVCHNHQHQLDDGHPAKTMKPEILNERTEIALGLSPLIVGPAEVCAVLFQFMLHTYTPSDVSAVYVWAATGALGKVANVGTPQDLWSEAPLPLRSELADAIGGTPQMATAEAVPEGREVQTQLFRHAVYDRLALRGRECAHRRLSDDEVLHTEPYATIYRGIAGEIRKKVLAHNPA